MEQRKFLAMVGLLAQADMQKSGILASLTIAQAILESGWGTSELATKANALFGIKADARWSGRAYSKDTKECYDGVTYATITALFRAYDSWAESVADHSAFLLANKRYAAVVGERDYKVACKAIKAAGYAADPDNTGMALNLAMSYCEMAMSSGDMSQYEKGMEIYEAVAAKTHPKYAEDAAKAKEDMALYTNNMVAKMQAANDFDGIIKMADDLLAKNPQSALAQNVRLQAYANKKDYAKVIELGQAAADAQTDPADKSLMYYLLGAAYNAKEMKPQAIAAFKQVTAGPAAENAKAALAELSK